MKMGHNRYRSVSIAAVCVLSVAGCGVDLNRVLIEAADIGATTAIDILLTDLVVEGAGTSDGVQNAPAEAADGGSSVDDDDSAGGGQSIDLVGDAVAGQDFFTSKGCIGCHCPDATGGCALNAPSLRNVETATLDAKLRVNGPHMGIDPNISDQQVADLQAFFASF